MSNLRHLDLVQKRFKLGIDPVFVLITKATGYCPLEPTQCRFDEISVHFFNYCILYIWWNNLFGVF